MKFRESQRCMYCGRFLFNADFELPFEIASTGALIVKLSMDINCGHCHRSHVYCVDAVPVSEPIRIDK